MYNMKAALIHLLRIQQTKVGLSMDMRMDTLLRVVVKYIRTIICQHMW